MKSTLRTTESLFADRVQNVPESFIREILKVASNPEIISFAGGLPNPSLFPMKELEEAASYVFQNQGMHALQYTSTEGYYPLREFISHRYRTRYGLKIPPEQIIITNGSQQALDLIGKIFINPGDSVLLERPTYLGALQCLSMFQPNFHEVQLNADGVDIDDLENKLWSKSMKLFYCIPNFQNPTGTRYSKTVREQMVHIMTRYNTYIIEDDPYGDIFFDREDIAPLYASMPEKTILLGSFSKSIAPGLRLGWMVASEEIIRKATIMKQASDLHSGNLTQYILHRFLTTHSLDVHLKKIQDNYRCQRDVMMSCLKQYFPQSIKYTFPQGGMFIWITLPNNVSARQLLAKAIEQKIIFVPGDSFYAKNPDKYTLRLNYSNVEVEQLQKAMNTLGGIVSTMSKK
jgi:2-aminoadipate transaminase